MKHKVTQCSPDVCPFRFSGANVSKCRLTNKELTATIHPLPDHCPLRNEDQIVSALNAQRPTNAPSGSKGKTPPIIGPETGAEKPITADQPAVKPKCKICGKPYKAVDYGFDLQGKRQYKDEPICDCQAEPKCGTCGGEKFIPSWPVMIPCPDCQDEPSGELVAQWEEFLEVGDDVLPLLDKAIKQAAARIEAMEKALEGHRWIPVSERLPEENKIVLVAGGIAKFINGSWWSGMEEPLYRREIVWEVIHWKPIVLPAKAALKEQE